MKLTVSNIAWETAEDIQVVALLQQFGVQAIEVAPAKLGPDPTAVDADSIASYRRWWEDHGIRISSMQALLFGRPDLAIFAGTETRRRTREYLARIIELGERLGVTALVFGSPKNRRVGSLPRDEAMAIAVEFFRDMGRIAADHGAVFCIEPNPEAYGCDFINTAAEGLELVRAVGEGGFRLHLDTGGMTLNGEDFEQELARCLPYLGHCHISEPHLQPVGGGEVDHHAVAAALRGSDYNGWVSIEMRSSGPGRNVTALRQTLDIVAATYGRKGE